MNDSADHAVLDWNGWLGQQGQQTQESIKAYLDSVPDEGQEAAKQQFASMGAVAQYFDTDLGQVAANWPVFRDGFAARQNDPDWTATIGNDGAFYQQLHGQLQEQQDQSVLLQGMEDNHAPGAAQASENSLANRAREAAYRGGNYADALSDWIGANEGQPGFVETNADQYAKFASEQFDAMKAMVDKVQPGVANSLRAFQIIKDFGGHYSLAADGGDAASPLAQLRDLSPSEKQLAFRMMTDLSLGNGADKTRTDAFFEGVFHGFENLLAGGSTAAWRSKLLQTQFAPGQQVHTSDPIKELTGEEAALAVSRSGPNSAMPSFYAQPTHALSADEAANWNTRLRQAVDDLDTGEQLRKFGQEVFDPTDQAGGYLFQKLVMPAADSTALIGSLELPGAWAPVLEMQARQFQNDNYARLRELGMEPEEANRIALVTGVANAALMKLQASVLEGFGNRFLPKTTAALREFALLGNPVARSGVNTAAGIGAVTVIGELQNRVIPAAVQDAMVNDPQFKPDWGQVWSDVVKDAPQAALGSVLLAAAGGGWQTLRQGEMAAQIRQFSSDPTAMLLRGYTAEQIKQIQAADGLGEKARLLDQWGNQPPPAAGPERDALIRDALSSMREQQELFAAKAQNETAAASDALDEGTRAVQDGDGWRVDFGDGKSVRVNTAEAARQVREDLRLAGNQQEAEAMGALIDGRQEQEANGVQRETTPENSTADPNNHSEEPNPEVNKPSKFADPRVLEGPLQGAAADAAGIGHARTDGVFEERALQGSVDPEAEHGSAAVDSDQGGSAVSDSLQERAETGLQRAEQAGLVSGDDLQRTARALAAQIDPETAGTPEGRALGEELQRAAHGEGDPEELRKTLAKLTAADGLGGVQIDQQLSSGDVTAALEGAARTALDATDASAIRRVREAIESVERSLPPKALKFRAGRGLRPKHREAALRQWLKTLPDSEPIYALEDEDKVSLVQGGRIILSTLPEKPIGLALSRCPTRAEMEWLTYHHQVEFGIIRTLGGNSGERVYTLHSGDNKEIKLGEPRADREYLCHTHVEDVGLSGADLSFMQALAIVRNPQRYSIVFRPGAEPILFDKNGPRPLPKDFQWPPP